MHGSYSRYVVYFKEHKLIHTQIDIKRVLCRSCGVTHAVLPIDIIAYRLLSLLVCLFILFEYYLKKTPALGLADHINGSFQFIYSVLHAFQKHASLIHLFFRRTAPARAPEVPCPVALLKRIDSFNPLRKFQQDYLSENNRPCLMCKFFDGGGGPTIGSVPPLKGAT